MAVNKTLFDELMVNPDFMETTKSSLSSEAFDGFFHPQGDPFRYKFLDSNTLGFQRILDGEAGVMSLDEIRQTKPNFLEQEIVRKNTPLNDPGAVQKVPVAGPDLIPTTPPNKSVLPHGGAPPLTSEESRGKGLDPAILQAFAQFGAAFGGDTPGGRAAQAAGMIISGDVERKALEKVLSDKPLEEEDFRGLDPKSLERITGQIIAQQQLRLAERRVVVEEKTSEADIGLTKAREKGTDALTASTVGQEGRAVADHLFARSDVEFEQGLERRRVAATELNASANNILSNAQAGYQEALAKFTEGRTDIFGDIRSIELSRASITDDIIKNNAVIRSLESSATRFSNLEDNEKATKKLADELGMTVEQVLARKAAIDKALTEAREMGETLQGSSDQITTLMSDLLGRLSATSDTPTADPNNISTPGEVEGPRENPNPGAIIVPDSVTPAGLSAYAGQKIYWRGKNYELRERQ